MIKSVLEYALSSSCIQLCSSLPNVYHPRHSSLSLRCEGHERLSYGTLHYSPLPSVLLPGYLMEVDQYVQSWIKDY